MLNTFDAAFADAFAQFRKNNQMRPLTKGDNDAVLRDIGVSTEDVRDEMKSSVVVFFKRLFARPAARVAGGRAAAA